MEKPWQRQGLFLRLCVVDEIVVMWKGYKE
jgi:hypothetical protein